MDGYNAVVIRLLIYGRYPVYAKGFDHAFKG